MTIRSVFSTAIFSLGLLYGSNSHAILSEISDAPFLIENHTRSIDIVDAKTGRYQINGAIDIKINSEIGAKEAAMFDLLNAFPDLKYYPHLEITSTTIRHSGTITPLAKNFILQNPSNNQTIISFGRLAPGDTAKIVYKAGDENPAYGLFSKSFTWGSRYPELAGVTIINSPTKLFLYSSKSTPWKQNPGFNITVSKDEQNISTYKIEMKGPINHVLKNEIGGFSSTERIPMILISNQDSWAKILPVIAKKFNTIPNTPLPPLLEKIITEANNQKTTDDKAETIVSSLHQFFEPMGDTFVINKSLEPQEITKMISKTKIDVVDFTYLTYIIMKKAGLDVDIVMTQKQSIFEKLIITEAPQYPNLDLFNTLAISFKGERHQRIFDPNLPITFTEGPLNDLQGALSVSITNPNSKIEIIPLDTGLTNHVAISETLNPKPDASGLIVTGTVIVTGPLGAELNILSHGQKTEDTNLYLRSLFGIGTSDFKNPVQFSTVGQKKSPSTMQTKNSDQVFSTKYEYTKNVNVGDQPSIEYIKLDMPGILGIPSLASSDRVTRLFLPENLEFHRNSTILNTPRIEETSASCISLTSVATAVHEVKKNGSGYKFTEDIRFKKRSISAELIKQRPFTDELNSYLQCANRTTVAIGLPAPLDSDLYLLSANEQKLLERPIDLLSPSDIDALRSIHTVPLKHLINTKLLLALRNQFRKGPPTDYTKLQYADTLIELGKIGPGIYLPLHIREANKIFLSVGTSTNTTTNTAAPNSIKNSSLYYVVHSKLLAGGHREKEAIVAINNAKTVALSTNGAALDASINILAAQIYMTLGDFMSAQSELSLAISDSKSITTRTIAIELLAEIAVLQKKTVEYQKLYSQILSYSKKNPWVYANYATGLRKLNLLNLALVNSRLAYQILPVEEFRQNLFLSLVQVAKSLYFTSRGQVTTDEAALQQAEMLAIESIKYSPNSSSIPYTIAGRISFQKALSGDYPSLIAAENYLIKAIGLGDKTSGTYEKYEAVKQAMTSGKKLNTIWSPLNQNKQRIPATTKLPANHRSSKSK